MPDKPIIRLEKISKKFHKKVALEDISLEIPEGSFYGLIGLSGSGKTTLMNIMVGFWKQSSGKVYFQDKNLKRYKNTIRQMFGFATQAGSVYGRLTVAENLKYFGKLYNMSKSDIQKRIVEVLRLVDLVGVENVLAKELSTGMSRRLDIACAMIHNPKILLLDEPTEDLDPVLRKEILALLKHINSQGTTIIMASHLLQEAEEVCDTMAIIHKGRILSTGSPAQLKSKYSKRNEIHLRVSSGNYKKLGSKLEKEKLGEVIIKRNKIVIYSEKDASILSRILKIAKSSKEKVTELNFSKPGIEEIFEVATKQ